MKINIYLCFCLILNSGLIQSCGDEKNFSEQNKSVTERSASDKASKKSASAKKGVEPAGGTGGDSDRDPDGGAGNDDVTIALPDQEGSTSEGNKTPSPSDSRAQDSKLINEMMVGRYLGGDAWNLSVARFTKLR